MRPRTSASVRVGRPCSYVRVIHGFPEISVFGDGEQYFEKNDTSSEGLMNLEYV